MEIQLATLATCTAATGTVVVIDVIRAFTTAVYAFHSGISHIYPVGTAAEAVALQQQWPSSLIMGEVNGFPPPEFDFGNSPSAFIGLPLGGRRLIQRTSAGTQGVVRSGQANTLLAASFACANATVRFIQRRPPAPVTLVCTDGSGEDQVCADYLAARLRGEMPDPTPFLAQVRTCGEARIAAYEGSVPQTAVAQFRADIECCTTLDYAPLALHLTRQGSHLVMEPVQS